MVGDIKKSQECYESKLKDVDSTLILLRTVSYQNKQIMEKLKIHGVDDTITSGLIHNV